MKSKTTAVILAIFLGGLGIHRFYLNRPISGVIYLIFCWSFIPAVISILEAISFMSYSEDAFNKKYADAGYLVSEAIKGQSNNNSKSQSSTEELVSLASLYEKNVITKEVFEEKNATLLKRIG